MATYDSFGDFIHRKRLEKGVTYRDLAAILEVTAPYVSDIEKGRRNAPTMEKLEKIINFFQLSKDETNMMFDLAGKTKEGVAPDLPEYLIKNDYVSAALRTARDYNATEKDWKAFINELKKRNI